MRLRREPDPIMWVLYVAGFLSVCILLALVYGFIYGSILLAQALGLAQ